MDNQDFWSPGGADINLDKIKLHIDATFYSLQGYDIPAIS